MDLASLMAAPRPLTIAGRTFSVYPLTIADLGDLQAWLNSQVPDPFKNLTDRIKGLSVDHQKYVLRDALDRAAKPTTISFQSDEASDLMRSAAGLGEILYLAVRRGDPSFTREKAAELTASLPVSAVDHLTKAIFGGDDKEGGEGDPKGE